MTHPEPVVDAWIRYHSDLKLGQAGPKDLFWVWVYIKYLVLDEPEKAWPVILELVQRAPTDRILADVAAGPLEDLIREHAKQFIDRVEIQACRDPKFQLCLTGVWYEKELPEDIRKRIEKYMSSSARRL